MTPNSLPLPDGQRLSRILPLLACPACRGRLQLAGVQRLQCMGCSASYPVRGGVPILLPSSMQEPGVGSVDAEDPVSMHPYSPASQEIIDSCADGWVLDLGAGGKLHRQDHVLQVDIFRYPMTDVVATADCLPFRDNAFRAVLSQAVFEHLQYPEEAASEVRRVLQPGGTAKIDTAFLQPEHGYPHHFYNATETGLRHWFREFDIEWSGVEPYQHPQWSLSWFLGVYIDRVDAVSAQVLRDSTIGDLLQALALRAAGKPAENHVRLLQALDALPAHEWRTLAAGVSIRGRNPAKLSATADSVSSLAPEPRGDESSAQTARKLLALREELDAVRECLHTQQEALALATDRSNYYARYLPSTPARVGLRTWLRFKLGALLRTALPEPAWQVLRRLAHRIRKPVAGELSAPFFSVIVDPRTPASLADAFFSLTHQAYTGWELVIIDHPQQPNAVRRAMRDFAHLDQRVRLWLAAPADTSAQRHRQARSSIRGRYRISLPEGGTFAKDALQVVYTLVRERPSTSVVVGDFERIITERGQPMRCHCMHLETLAESMGEDYGFAWHATPVASTGPGASPAYVPDVLFRQNVSASRGS